MSLFALVLVMFIGLGIALAANRAIVSRQKAKSEREGRLQGWSDAVKANEAAVLRLARKNGGKVTVADVAAESAMTLEEAQSVLETFERSGYAIGSVNSDGFVEYHILGLTSESSTGDSPTATLDKTPRQSADEPVTLPPPRQTGRTG